MNLDNLEKIILDTIKSLGDRGIRNKEDIEYIKTLSEVYLKISALQDLKKDGTQKQ